MKFSALLFFVVPVFIAGMAVQAQPALPALSSPQNTPSQLSESVEDVVADLTGFIPAYMREQRVPGVGIALIRDGKVAWTEGFGVASVLSGRRISPETIFEVASNSKVVTAYIALRLVDMGRLSLDVPLNTYLTEPWLPPSEYRNTITLRHVLSHSAGLGHNTVSRYNRFAPGSGYSYSAMGIQYAQEVIEEVTGRSFEQIAREIVFHPLGMVSSSFINRPELRTRTANGHVWAILPVLLFVVCYLVMLLFTLGAAIVVRRIWSGKWRLSRGWRVSTFIVAYILAMAPLYFLTGSTSLLEFAWLIALLGLLFIIVVVLFYLAGRYGIHRLKTVRKGVGRLMTTAWLLLVLAGLILLAFNVRKVPVPRWPQTEALGAGTMRASVGDMAAFLIELSDPTFLSEEMASQLRAPQVQLTNDLSWGLGPGIYHGRRGDVLWQWGQHIDFQSVMMISHDGQRGVVVCTNSDLFNPDVAIEIAQRASGEDYETIRQAIHLAFNYSGDDS